jgi:putative RNA 2'-phosphotransferase
MDNVAISKFLSFVLRHEPEAIGLVLDREGWADIATLLDAAAQNGRRFDRAMLQIVVETNDKQRFSISEDGTRIRAVQGHSTASVEIAHVERIPPEFLFHGTATRFLDSIRASGLRPGSRQHVHLSADMTTAIAVGKRHGTPTVLTIAALRMLGEGHKFYRADNGVWLTAHVPTEFLTERV